MLRKLKEVQLAFKTWKGVKSYLEHSDVVIIPIGAVEQHGLSCPLNTDSILAEYFSLAVGESYNVLVSPTIVIGDSLIHLNYPGTIAIKPTTLLALIKDYVNSLYLGGFRRFLVVNGHGDNYGIIMAAFSELANELTGMHYHVKDFWDFPSFRKVMKKYFGDSVGGHADATDASILLAIDESLVNKALFTKEFARVKHWVSRDLSHELYSVSGVINSDQGLATAEIGKELISEAIKGYSSLLRELMQ